MNYGIGQLCGAPSGNGQNRPELFRDDSRQALCAASSYASRAAAKRAASSEVEKVAHRDLDALEAAMLDTPGLELIHLPVKHTFTPGLYCREVFMEAGAVLTSKAHETEHPFVVLSGAAEVAIPGEPAVTLAAGHFGVTRAGTRRALRILEDCAWITFHPLTAAEELLRQAGASDAELLAAIEARIIGQPERADGRDIHAEYRERLAAAGLPGPNDGAPALPAGGEG